jgi:hypothetical protein
MSVNPTKLLGGVGKRVLTEFTCYCSKKYIYVYLHTGVDGNYTIVCPTCYHEHHRTIRGGFITEDRHSDFGKENVYCERIIPMPSAASATKREFGKIAQLRQMEVGGQAR